MEKKTFTINYGTRYESYYNDRTQKVVCTDEEVVAIACAIYLGHVGDDIGWCEVITPTKERITIADCM